MNKHVAPPGPETSRKNGRGSRLGLAAVRSSYRRYAPVYDMVFGAFLDRGRRVAIAAIERGASRRILEIGVGTGLSLPRYSANARVVGIDLSPEMLEKARRRAQRLGLAHVEALEEMDARNTAYADDSFDVVVAMYVLSVTPDPERLLQEMRRLCAPGGDILIVNRFSSTKPLRRAIERVAEPLSAAIGFNTQMSWDVLAPLGDLEVVGVRSIPGLAGASLVHIHNRPATSPNARQFPWTDAARHGVGEPRRA